VDEEIGCKAACSSASGADEAQTRANANRGAVANEATARSTSAMKKKPAKKKAASKRKPRKDAWQNALSIVEQVTGGKLRPRR
jgi:hypothetical protein